MRKHSSKILLLGVVCLAFLFILSSLFGCKLSTLFQKEPEFREVIFICEEVEYKVKIPADMPDFTQFEYQQITPVTPLLAMINYYAPDGKTSDSGVENHYRFIVSMVIGDCPGVLILLTFIDDQIRFWLYNEEGEPFEVTMENAQAWLDVWQMEQMEPEDDGSSI